MSEIRLIDANALRERLLVLRSNIANVQCISNIFDICLTEVSNAPTITPKLPTEVRKALEVLDTIEQNRWVPVSERLPEENVCDDGYHEPSKWVLVQARNGHMYTTRYWTRDKNNVWTDLDYPDDIIAWQPLPARYKEGGEE